MRVSFRPRAAFGPVAGVLFLAGVEILGWFVPGYSQVRQTVSEIGEVGSPARVPFSLLLLAVAACVLVFASALRTYARRAALSVWPAYATAALAISAAGAGVFAFPHPLHNVFGLSETVGYQAPLVLALAWRRDRAARGLVIFSAVMAAAVWLVLAVNLIPLFRPANIWPHVKPVYGLVQRSLFATWFTWCAGVGFRLSRADADAVARSPAA